jgi:transaldolase
VELVKVIVNIYRNYGIKAEVIAASIRNPRQVREIAEAGADITTIPFKVLEGMLQHPKTMEGIKRFSEDVVPEYRKLFDVD